MEINKPAVRKWVERLRDPNSKQGNCVLGKVDGRRCCLGVACDIAVEEGIIDPPVPASTYEDTDVLSYDDEVSYLPLSVQKWLGVPSINPNLKYNFSGGWREATFMNDSLKMSFAEIADAIEETFLKDDETDKN